MAQAVSRAVGRQQELLDGLRSRPVLTDPTATFGRRYEQLTELRHRAHRAVATTVDRESAVIEHHLARIRAMSPQATLDRGYSASCWLRMELRSDRSIRSASETMLQPNWPTGSWPSR